MNVSGIRPNAMFYQYNSIKLNELRNHQIEQSKRAQLMAENIEEVEVNTAPVISEEDLAAMQQEARERQTFSSYDYANQYQAGQEFELKGVDSDINSLDVEKALSTMQKDSVIQQYQFFVGDMNPFQLGIAQEQAVARTGENFVL